MNLPVKTICMLALSASSPALAIEAGVIQTRQWREFDRLCHGGRPVVPPASRASRCLACRRKAAPSRRCAGSRPAM